MQIKLNGEFKQIVDQCSITEILKILDLQNIRLAVEVNLEVIPHAQHASFMLSAGDNIEIIQAVGGG
jgi:sulfur carrier protein|tara:strand:- start:866 stop:1066 length:201 start_codon:yes stop_codon:yes gene_type:complete